MTKQIDAVVFDLDGTLVHSTPDIHASMNAVLAELGRPLLDLQTVTSFVGQGVENLMAQCLTRTGVSDTQLQQNALRRFLEIYEANATALTRPYPGVLSCLESLIDQGFALGICTNKVETAALKVCNDLDIARYFKVIQGAVDTLPKKPNPDMLTSVITALGATPKTALYVGDSTIDQETALNADVDFAFFTGGYLNSPLHPNEPAITFDAWPFQLNIT